MTDIAISGRPLAECPFCGDDDVEICHSVDGVHVSHFVCCNGCGCEGPVDPNPAEARRRWNSRS